MICWQDVWDGRAWKKKETDFLDLSKAYCKCSQSIFSVKIFLKINDDSELWQKIEAKQKNLSTNQWQEGYLIRN